MERNQGIYERFFKRPQDFILSLTAIILLSPILLIISILVKINLGSPIFFVQERPGLNEKTFKMYKFRTMSISYDESGEARSDSQRLTKFGHILRATSLDELPELWNILCGDMSIVGPRPLLVEYLPLYDDEQSKRHLVRPGLTGYAQINGRNAITWEQKFDFDVKYVDNLCFKLDWEIIIKTLFKVFKREGINSSSAVTMEAFKGTKKKETDS